MLMGMMSYVVRVLFYTLLDSKHAWFVLFAEPLHGVTYSLLQMATVQEIAEITPSHLQATGQGFLTFFKKLGILGGVLGGGYVMQTFGAVVAYRSTALLVSLAAVVYGTTNLLFRQKQHKNCEQESSV